MLEFLRRMSFLKVEFNSLLPANKLVVKDLDQWDKFFMMLTLVFLSPNLDFVLDQILANVVIPSLDEVFTRLLHRSFPGIIIGSFSYFSLDTSVLASQTQHRDRVVIAINEVISK